VGKSTSCALNPLNIDHLPFFNFHALSRLSWAQINFFQKVTLKLHYQTHHM
jgi:hypothetical protein